MPTRFPRAHFRAGMVLKVSVYFDGGILLPAGTTITERHLQQLDSWGITEVETEKAHADFRELVTLPQGGQHAPDALKPVSSSRLPPGHDAEDGRIYVVTGDVTQDHGRVYIDRPVLVEGNVARAASLESAKVMAHGDIVVRGTVNGSERLPASLEGTNISLQNARFALVFARQKVEARSLVSCNTTAGAEVIVKGGEGIVSGKVEAGLSIHADFVTGNARQALSLKILQSRQKQLFVSATRLEKALEEKRSELGKLEKIMEVIRLLGEKVVALPPEKKLELALHSKRYLALKSEIADHAAALERIQNEIGAEEAEFQYCPVQLGKVAPVVELTLGTAMLRINSYENATGYYLKNNRILACSE